MEKELLAEIISLKDYKDAKQMGELRQYPDSYEYCLIPNYEDKFAESHTECIQMDECFANIIKSGDRYVLISIIFSDEWSVEEIVDWIANFEITLHQPKTAPIDLPKSNSIIDAKKFKGYPLVLSERGTKTLSLDPNVLTEVTVEYDTYKKITNTGLAHAVESMHEFLDKDDCLGREYPGIAGEEDEPLFERLMENIQYSETVRGLFVYCQNCSFEGVIVHARTFEIIEPFCPHCGKKIAMNHCEWINGPF